MRRHLRHGRGATRFEFALVLPYLRLLACGTAALGLAWTAENRVQGAVAQAARVGASNGATRESDRDILLSLKVTLEPNVLQRVERVVVFSATDADGAVPTVCRNATGDVGNTANRCNSYSGDRKSTRLNSSH